MEATSIRQKPIDAIQALEKPEEMEEMKKKIQQASMEVVPTQQASENARAVGESTIYALCKVCLQFYLILIEALRNTTEQEASEVGFRQASSLSAIEDAHIRFKAWATNIAALQQPILQSSLDARLIEATNIRQRVLKILAELKKSLETALPIVTGINPNERWHVGAIENSDGDEEDTAADENETTELKELFSAIQMANGALMRLSMVIRDSPQRDDYLKAASRISLDTLWDIGHVKEKYGASKRNQDWLIERLGRSITRRRQFLKYREDHHWKLSQDWENLAKEITTKEEVTAKDGSTTKEDARTIAETKATTFVGPYLDPVQEGSDAGGSFGSQTSYDFTVKGDPGPLKKLRVPPPPKIAFEGVLFEFGEPFQCPYCYMEQIVENKTAWKRHVFRDLRPYVCTFKGCHLKMFGSRNAWFAHELRNHRRKLSFSVFEFISLKVPKLGRHNLDVLTLKSKPEQCEWICPSCAQAFQGRKDFHDHLVAVHGLSATGLEIEALILQSEEPVDKIPASACMLCDDLEMTSSGHHQAANRYFLDDSALGEQYVTLHQFRRHLGRHMEQLALFALPRNETEESDGDHRENDQSEEIDDDSNSRSGRSSEDENEVEHEVEHEVEEVEAEHVVEAATANIATATDIPQKTPPIILTSPNSIRDVLQRDPASIGSILDSTGDSSQQNAAPIPWKLKAGLRLIRKPWSRSKRPSDKYNVLATPVNAQKPIHKVSPIEIRELCDLIRVRYNLDCLIWSWRHCTPVQRPRVEQVMRRADAVLLQILRIVHQWDTGDVWQISADWERLKEIRRRIEYDGKRMWVDHPPWEEKSGGHRRFDR